MRVTKNKLRVEWVLASLPHTPRSLSQPEKITHWLSYVKRNRYGALSSTLQTSNNNTTPQPRTPKRKATTAGTGTASATPASRKRGWKQAEKSNREVEGEKENEGAEDEEDAVPEPAMKKARTKAKATSATPVAAAEGGVKVKSEFWFEEAVREEVLGEEEVSIF
jgi:hypothetical protein